MDTDARTNALEFLKQHATGVLATLSPDGAPRARTIYYSVDDSFNIYFFTLTSTRKVEDLKQHDQGAFVVYDEEAPRTVQMEGTIENLTEVATVTPEVRRLSDLMQERGLLFAPLTRLDPGQIIFYKLTPTWVRWGDFTHGRGADSVLTEITP